ncbi:MAG: superoxide dismutase, Ni [Sulfurospirillaceae bacterium]|nr:superoxide dismutase, Ni [Sulfurospirillaceae bacterium]MDD3463454.1 superoxide dismutase, Ni [Sulfurospirillaceae bacterium]
MKKIFEILKPQSVSAHCDVPCGIYDPIVAQIAALSVIRMVDQIKALVKGDDEVSYFNTLSRYIAVKESEAIKCKDEIRIIWGDFIKPAHLEKYPEIHTIVHNIMALGGASKQHVSREKALELLQEVNKFAEIFWAIKGVPTKSAKAPYLPNEIVVYPVL